MNKLILIFAILAFVLPSGLYGQQINKAEAGIFLLKGGELELMDDGRIKADLLIQDGLIKEIAENIDHPTAQRIDCSGLIVFPGMIDSGTRLGLGEVGSISLTQDHNEIGTYTPQMQALTAVNPNSVSIPVTRVNGVTSVLTVPSGDRFPGTAAMIDLLGYTPNQMYSGFKGLVFNFPSAGRRGWWDSRSEDEIKKAKKKQWDEINDFWDKAKLYNKIIAGGKKPDYNPQLQAMVPVLNKEMPLLIEVNERKAILSAIKWGSEQEIDYILTGVSEGYLVADSLAKYDVPVITGPVLNNPSRNSDHYDVAYSNAGKMQKAGVRVAIRTNETENVRNLPFNAGFAAAYGMEWKEAFKAVTIMPAQIFGVDDKYGSLERNKIANLFVADGDPFEPKTDIKYLFIRGYNIPLESRHSYLYDEFLEREPGLDGN